MITPPATATISNSTASRSSMVHLRVGFGQPNPVGAGTRRGVVCARTSARGLAPALALRRACTLAPGLGTAWPRSAIMCTDPGRAGVDADH